MAITATQQVMFDLQLKYGVALGWILRNVKNGRKNLENSIPWSIEREKRTKVVREQSDTSNEVIELVIVSKIVELWTMLYMQMLTQNTYE